MSEKTFLDPNVFAFASRHGMSFGEAFEKLQDLGELATDVKGLQEIVYRFHLMGATKEGYENAMKVRRLVEVLPIREEELERQENLMARYPNLKPRELLHAAAMLNAGISRILCDPESGYADLEEVEVRTAASSLGLSL